MAAHITNTPGGEIRGSEGWGGGREGGRWGGILTGQDLEDGGEEEASALDQPEQLIQEGDEGEEAEEHRQDHEGLHRLDPVWETSTEREFRRPERWERRIGGRNAGQPSLLAGLQW